MNNPWEYFVTNEYNIILDTCSLMNAGFTDALLVFLINSLRSHRKKVCIPEKVREEIRYHARNSATKNQADKAWSILNQLDKEGLMYIDSTGCNNDSRFADTAIDSIVSRDMASKNILLISQDRNLVHEIINKMNNRAIRTKQIVVKKISNGNLVSHNIKEDPVARSQHASPTKMQIIRTKAAPHSDAKTNIILHTASDCSVAVQERLDINNYRTVLNKIIRFMVNREDFEIAYTILNLIDGEKCSLLDKKEIQKVSQYFIQRIFDEITSENCMKYRVLFQLSIRFRQGFSDWSNYGENKRNDKFLSKFTDIALKYDKDFIKRHYYEYD